MAHEGNITRTGVYRWAVRVEPDVKCTRWLGQSWCCASQVVLPGLIMGQNWSTDISTADSRRICAPCTQRRPVQLHRVDIFAMRVYWPREKSPGVISCENFVSPIARGLNARLGWRAKTGSFIKTQNNLINRIKITIVVKKYLYGFLVFIDKTSTKFFIAIGDRFGKVYPN